jgi:hypothetical protein
VIARDAKGGSILSEAVSVTIENEPHTARIEETDSRIAFDTSWIQGDTSRAWSGGTAAVTRQGSARLTFRGGESVKWIGLRGPEGGIARVWLGDAVDPKHRLLAEVDTYGPEEKAQARLFSVAGVGTSGRTWTLTIESTGRNNPNATDNIVVVDAF